MKNEKFWRPLFFYTICFFFCLSRLNAQGGNSKINLQKIIFHSSGTTNYCPKIDLVVDSDRNIIVSREFYLKRSPVEKHYSGYFKGRVKKNYAQLIALLETFNPDSLKFPVGECYDGIMTTIIVYYNGQRKYFRSMLPPPEAEKIILFLNNLGVNTKLKKSKEVNNLEE